MRDSPKAAALRALASEAVPQPPFVRLDSRGVLLIYGRDEAAVQAAELLKDRLDVTVLIKPPAILPVLPAREFPVAKGAIRTAKGYLGSFELTVDDFTLRGPSRDGGVSRCDIVLDLSG